ncbi:MAG: Gfo/Idh/MocA family oxidoreductase [Planctomycetia bacterium]|nr:Gfo/Idh/MocA family oxidoreductase [Planctomycetia bacterium]
MQNSNVSRRGFLTSGLLGLGASLYGSSLLADDKVIAGFDQTQTDIDASQVWQPFSDRKVRVGIVGNGVCKFGSSFGYQDHPNVEVAAVSDLFPDRCDELAQACRCEKKYPSLEELVKDDSIEAVFVATDAPSHVDHVLKCLEKGKHVMCAVPAVFGRVEDGERLLEAVKKSGKIYALNETSAFHDDLYASRLIYQAGGFGKMNYTEGEYFHYSVGTTDSYKGWRIGLPPQWYPTHSNAYYTCVTGGSFTEVSCFGHVGSKDCYKPGNNTYNNTFGSETALFKTSEGGVARMAVNWDAACLPSESGRNRGQFGSYLDSWQGMTPESNAIVEKLKLKKPALPPGMDAGGHGGSHGYLTVDFIDSILRERKPCVDIITALNTTIAGVIAHESAMRDGELLKIPQYKW